MPDSRPERIAFAVGLAAIAALAIAVVPAYHSYSAKHSSLPRSAPSLAAPRETAQQTAYRPPASSYARPILSAPLPAAKQTTAPAAKAKSKAKAPPAGAAKVSLAASRGDCWLEVRAESSKGKLIYVGTLAKGKAVSASGKSIWVRLGAPQNIDIKVDGKAVTVPGGTQNVIVTKSGAKATA